MRTSGTPESINFMNFNQDATCISAGTSNGYKIFNCDPFGKCYSRHISSVALVEMLYVTSLLAVVGIGEHPNMSPRRLKIINTKRQSTICELTFPTTILSVKLNRERMVVVLEQQIYIYDVSSMKLLHTIETLPNPHGLVALSPIIEHNFLAYPSPPANKNGLSLNTVNEVAATGLQPANSSITSRVGDVIIFDAKSLQPLCVIEAHKAGLAAISLSSDGLLLASASVKGTIIRVFSVETGEKLYQFRRGTYGTKIYSLSFSDDNNFLTASSATETVHIFKLSDEYQVNKLSVYNDVKSRSSSFNSKPPGLQNDQYSKSKLSQKVRFDENKLDSEDDNDNEDEGGDVEVDDDDDDDDDEYELRNEDSNEQDDEVGPLPSTPKKYPEIDLVDESGKKIEPIIDQTRRSVGRLIRKSSQSLGRRAAETMGIYLPKRVTSVLKPIRHFASLKIPASNGTKSVVAMKHLDGNISDSFLEKLKLAAPNLAQDIINNGIASKTMLEVIVVTGNGLFLKYALEGDRGGDCILLSQYSLLDGAAK
ncbi:phosphoinositide binding protein [Saccharomycopsis crataegensis]|uniref:Phosphoinositide binding protein n=1 Tax=Saccharomycopsis crataegensis TaxID=43959 RepID=A0AAV5QFN5_9ASCO|nr:phosphoinositide binding protein [Saccharomycopsis crataegensis]